MSIRQHSISQDKQEVSSKYESNDLYDGILKSLIAKYKVQKRLERVHSCQKKNIDKIAS